MIPRNQVKFYKRLSHQLLQATTLFDEESGIFWTKMYSSFPVKESMKQKRQKWLLTDFTGNTRDNSELVCHWYWGEEMFIHTTSSCMTHSTSKQGRGYMSWTSVPWLTWVSGEKWAKDEKDKVLVRPGDLLDSKARTSSTEHWPLANHIAIFKHTQHKTERTANDDYQEPRMSSESQLHWCKAKKQMHC